jgi:hypothetical protein
MQFVRGERGCNPTDDVTDPVSVCNALIGQGGWGPNFLTDPVEAIPNKNVYVYNNIFYNPLPARTLYSHFGVYGPLSPPAGFMNVPSPSRTDDNLVIRGNLIWNGTADHPLGIEETDQGCQNDNPTCNASQLRSENVINSMEPQFINPSNGDFHPLAGGTIFDAQAQKIPGFTWSDAPVRPSVPQGDLVNMIPVDRDGLLRTTSSIPGAYSVSSGFDELTTVQKVYIAYYLRPADPGGLYWWAQQLNAAGGNMNALIDAYANSEEALRLWGTINSSNIGTLIDKVYMALFNRAPDTGGKQFYVNGFNSGQFTPGTIVLNILDGATGQDAEAIANKLNYSNKFVAVLDPDGDYNIPFEATYNADDEQAARELLAEITSVSDNITTQQVRQDVIDFIADPGDSILN